MAEIGSIALGGLLFGVLGFAMEWRPGYIVAAALAFALSTWLARSLGRAVLCMIGSLGLLAGVLVLLAKVDAGIFGSLGIGWGTVFLAWWVMTAALAGTFRLTGADPEFGAALAVGGAIGVFISAVVAAKLDFQSNLLFYLVGLEDNAAWVGLATQNGAVPSIAAQVASSNLGPVMPLLLGVLQGPQKQQVASTNAVFAAYTLAIVLSPLLAASPLRGAKNQSQLKLAVFALIVFAWLFLVPALLYRDFGHLSTIWAVFGFLTFASLVAFDRAQPTLIPIAIGVLLFLGGAWFPIAPLAACLIIATALIASRSAGRNVRLAVWIAIALGALALVLQLRASGVAIGTDLVALKNSISGLYQSPGGVAQIDPVLRVLIVGGVVGFSFLASKLGDTGKNLISLLLISIGYVVVVYAGSSLISVGEESYGATKVAFVVLYSTAVVLVAVTALFSMSRSQVTAVALALTLGALTFGGGTLLLQRSWPGDGSYPTWLPVVEKVVESQETPRPVVCFAATDGQASYFCTRWAGAISKAGDGAYVDYRLTAFKGTISAANMKPLEESGTLRQSDVIFLQRPTKNAWWGKVLLRDGGRVFGPTGKPLKRRSISAIELLPPPAPAK